MRLQIREVGQEGPRGAKGGPTSPFFWMDENKFTFYKHTIEVYVRCS